ncbi:helix-turn-helix domain-containing protein [Mucilaginibacter xinganensis]|uniref:DNA-binding transcriptional regulator, XRE-family HTH domain n=1 Tax=Mucilaginibacter xinganensis TaxID=1234841 RepID=A0A223NR35_9SPHI|nr:helix-turn-helix transcriptional regulator [Mucilaginibacter xinganensis]ASU32372.1 DNA-binding transcriptional regulator, XRE-family HTH domain [Mucilaginibacter xinganensis]
MGQLRSIEAIKLLADNVKLYRQGRDLSQEALANIADMEFSQVSRIERELINTSVSAIFLLAKALNIRPSQLLAPISSGINYRA